MSTNATFKKIVQKARQEAHVGQTLALEEMMQATLSETRSASASPRPRRRKPARRSIPA